LPTVLLLHSSRTSHFLILYSFFSPGLPGFQQTQTSEGCGCTFNWRGDDIRLDPIEYQHAKLREFSPRCPPMHRIKKVGIIEISAFADLIIRLRVIIIHAFEQ
jgi:hypothetical protein